nr:hypothetical protein L204_00750 [Cryptococcus depauperatus CBS 7855]
MADPFSFAICAWETRWIVLSAEDDGQILGGGLGMIEKGMARTLAEYDGVEEARARNGVVVFVGDMRRFAPALERWKIKGKDIMSERYHGNHKYFTSQSGKHQREYTDFPNLASSALLSKRTANFVENLGHRAHAGPRNMHSWSLDSMASHDLSAMWDAVGMPERCIIATSDDGQCAWRWMTLLQYKASRHITWESTMSQCLMPLLKFTLTILALKCNTIHEFRGYSTTLKFYGPFVKDLPIRRTIQCQLPDGDYSEHTRPNLCLPIHPRIGFDLRYNSI